MDKLAERAQLGHVDIQWISRSERSRYTLANYVAVNGLNFALTMTALGATRIQPFSPSTTWRTS